VDTTGRRDDLGTVGAWVQTPEDEKITEQAFAAASELGWVEGSKEEYFAFVSGFRVGALRTRLMTDLRSHEPPRNPSTDLPQDEPVSAQPRSTPPESSASLTP